MKQVYTSEDRIYIYHLKNILETEGIQCTVKNDNLSSLAGEIPLTAIWPELWVLDPDMEKWAKVLINQSRKEADQSESWKCENCGEEHSAQFSECWNCHNLPNGKSVKAF